MNLARAVREAEPPDVDGRGVVPAAEPFFGAAHGDPMGLASRRRDRWTRGRVTDYWDEVFTAGRQAQRPVLLMRRRSGGVSALT